MVKEATREFVRNNRDLLSDVAKRRDSPVSSIAAAFLAAVPPEEDENSRKTGPSEGEAPEDNGAGPHAGLDRYFEG